MKLLLAVFSALLLSSAANAQDASKVARELISAYQNKDAAGVKKHMSPMLAATVDKKYFEDGEIMRDVKALRNWDGKIREVRYFASKFGVMAAVRYDESPDPSKVKLFSLIKSGKTWKHGMQGFYVLEKDKFRAYGLKEPSGKDVPAPAKAAAAAGDNSPLKGYSIEMADGTKAEAPSVNQLKKMLAKLDDDNFFLTLTSPDGGFMQGGYSEAGLDLQYRDSSGHFTSEAVVSPESGAEIFAAYLKGEPGWKAKCKWKPFE